MNKRIMTLVAGLAWAARSVIAPYQAKRRERRFSERPRQARPSRNGRDARCPSYQNNARTAASMPSTSTTCFCVIGALSIATKAGGGFVSTSVPNARRHVSGNL